MKARALDYPRHQDDPAGWAQELGVSTEACELLLGADFIDLHLDLEVPIRVYGYDPHKRHGPWTGVKRFWGHTDYPRLRESGFTGLVYDIATNPFRPKGNRLRTTLDNIKNAVARIESHPNELAVIRTKSDYDQIRKQGRTGFWLSLQGGNALSADPEVLLGDLGKEIHRITLVHLTTSDLGGTNSPAGGDIGLTDLGKRFVEICNEARVLVDLAHSGKKTFWDALEVHSADRIPIVSHTGVEAVRPHWRNVDDDQIRAIAERGGVVGIMYQSDFLAPTGLLGSCERRWVVDHIEHVIDVAGEDVPAIGTDYDGMIIPPHDLADVTHHPLLVQDMLDRGWSEERIRKILGLNYLRVVDATRP